MEFILYFLPGLLLGGIIVYLLFRSHVQKDFVSHALHENAMLNANESKENFQRERLENLSNRQTILQLTRESEQKFSRSEIDKAYVAKEAFDLISEKLNAAEEELGIKEKNILFLSGQVTGLNKKEEYLNDKISTFQKELEQLHLVSQEQFKNLASAIMEEKRKTFVETNKIELNSIIEPLQERLKEFREKIEATRKEDIAEMTSLKNEIGSLEKLSYQLSDDAKNLALALKSEVKMQGNWGEDRLNMILETEGLQKHIDYNREEVLKDHEQEINRRPDFILKLPDGKHIVIDSKVSLSAYVNYFNAASQEEKTEFLKQHLRSLTTHIDQLSEKNYQSLAGLSTPDYVFMFMPVESALTLALNQNPELFNNAVRKKIILITPTTLVATLKVIKMLWKKEKQVKNVEEIFRQCGELYDKFVVFLEQIKGVEDGLHSALKAHQEAMYSLTEGNRKGNTIIGRFEAIRKLEAKTNRQIPEEYTREIELLEDENQIVT
jgi:DNA recombination protein RmuC